MKLPDLTPSVARRPIVCLAVIVVGFALIGARWIWMFRDGQPLDIDEAGYLDISLRDYYSFVRAGAPGLLSTVWAPTKEAPLTTALAALLYCFIGPHPIAGFAIPLGAAIGTITATYFLAAKLGTRITGVVSAAIVASCPMIITYSRSFHFSIPAAFMATLALLALLQSDRCRYLGWASVFGICCGLMPLARTMTIAFLPGLFLGALIYIIVEPGQRIRRLTIYLYSLSLAFVVAMSWLGFNWRYVFQYLLSYGYGSHAGEYGPSHPLFSGAEWLFAALIMIKYAHLPHFLLLLAGAIAASYLVAQAVARGELRSALFRMASSPLIPVAIYSGFAILALVSSQNAGSAFFAPVLPAAAVLAIAFLERTATAKPAKSILAIGILLVTALGGLPSVDLRSVLAIPWRVYVAGLGYLLVTDGRGSIEVYEAEGGFIDGNSAQPLPAAIGQSWLRLSEATATALRAMPDAGIVAFGFRHYLYNSNMVALYELVDRGVETGFRQVDPILTGNSCAGDVEWLTKGDAADARTLLTSNDPRQFEPVIDNDALVRAAMQAGFHAADKWEMPDGYDVTIWKR